MNDLLKRLRSGSVDADTAEEAAATIERLVAALGSAKVALLNRKSPTAESMAVAALADIAAAIEDERTP